MISPHGRGVRAQTNARLWRELPAHGVRRHLPGRHGTTPAAALLGLAGQIDDLARMPSIRDDPPVAAIDPQRVYAVGGSMGGQETLLLLGRYPRLLAGAVAFDSVTDFCLRYSNSLASHARGAAGTRPRRGRRHAADEPAGVPPSQPHALGDESPRSGVPLQIWWSDADEIVVDQPPSRRRSSQLPRLGPHGRLEQVTGSWSHTAESYARLQLPGAVRWLGLDGDV